MNARRLVLAVVATFSPLAVAALFGSPAALADESCPNSQLRTGYAANLPDCRAYELVSPPGAEPDFELISKAGNVIRGREMPGEARGVVASVTGERLMFTSSYPPAGSPSDGPYFLSTRGPTGWSTEDLIPPQSPDYGLVCYNAYTPAFTPDLSSAVLADGYGYRANLGLAVPCGTDEPALVAGEPRGYQNLFVRNNEAGSYRLINLTPAGASYHDAWFQAASEDLSHVVFDEQAQLTPEAPASDDLYEWSGGVVRLVTFLPNGTPTEGSLANANEPEGVFAYSGSEMFTHAVSADGSRVFFYAKGNLYMRRHADQQQSPVDGEGHCADPAKGCTIQVDASQTGGSGGGGKFMWASADGSLVIFTDEASAALTADTVPGSGQNLYEYDLLTSKLTNLTPVAQAGVEGVSGSSEDGSYLYFVAEGALTGEQQNSHGAKAESGQPNLYLFHAGATTFIATLASTTHMCLASQGEEPCGGDWLDWNPRSLTARVSPNGKFIGFNSVKSLTGYDNAPARPGDCNGEEGEVEACQDIFLYDAARNRLSCASCDPSGASPTAPTGIYEPAHDWFGGPNPKNAPGNLQRNLLDDGRVFFTTAEALVPQDTNGQYDAYEYEGGLLHLISTATSSVGSYFYEASPSGNDAFFITAEQLPAGNPEAVYSVYDARVDGGFPEPGSLTACSEEDCKGAFSAPPAFSAPSSATFVGAGNQPPVVTVHRSSKVVKKKTKKKRGKKRKNGRKSSRARRVVHSHRGGVK